MDTRPQERDDSQDRALVTLTQEEGRKEERTILSSAQRFGNRTPCYSRTCPVTISHPSSLEKLVGLAIIDDQAKRTYMDPIVDRTLKLPPEAKKQSTHGTIHDRGRISDQELPSDIRPHRYALKWSTGNRLAGSNHAE